MTWLKGRRGPEVEGVDGLDVVVPVQQHGWLAGGLKPVGIGDRVSGRFDDFGVLQANPFVLLGEVGGRTPDLAGPLRLARDAGDPQKLFEFLQPLVPGIFKEFFGGDHYRLLEHFSLPRWRGRVGWGP